MIPKNILKYVAEVNNFKETNAGYVCNICGKRLIHNAVGDPLNIKMYKHHKRHTKGQVK